jgi:ABC-type branched-subunit amino acid transport system substrate-binding protein
LPRPVPFSSLAAPRRALGSLAVTLVLGLAACAPQPPRPSFVGIAPPIGGQQPVAPAAPQPQRAALLLPLSGAQAPLGQAMLNASYMALFDEAPGGVEFAPRDTGSTPQGAQAAARAAIADGARVVVGPLTSGEAAMVGPVARAAGVPMLAYTNDAQRAGDGAWVLGTTPQQQVRRIVSAAARQGAQRFAMAAPDSEFGRALASAITGAAADLGLPAPAISLYPGAADPGMAAGAARSAAGQVDAVLVGEAGERARRFAAGWIAAMPEGQQAPRMLGTALWLGDANLRNEAALGGAWFPGPDGAARARFEARYREAFRETPPRIAAAAYDAAAIAARALRSGTPVDSVTAVQHFAGADGPVRLLPGGQTQRGLAVYALTPGGEPLIVDAAPVPGGAGF